MSGAITAATAAVASVGLGVYSSMQAGRNASAARGMQDTVFNEQQYYAQQLQNLVSNPDSVINTPGYKFQFQQGEQAVLNQMTAQGFGQSGNLGQALVNYGQNEASTVYQQEFNNYAQLSGLTAPTSVGQYGQETLAAQQQSYNQMGGQLASLMYLSGRGGGGSPGGLFGGMFGGGANPYQGVTDTAGGTSPYAIQTAPMSGGYVPVNVFGGN